LGGLNCGDGSSLVAAGATDEATSTRTSVQDKTTTACNRLKGMLEARFPDARLLGLGDVDGFVQADDR
jgi:hypothetical protein